MSSEKHTIPHGCVIILAGGKSRRLGEPKQLLAFEGKTLLEKAVDTALEAAIGPVAVVLGAGSEKTAKVLSEKKVDLIINNEWQEGIASSIRSGLQFVIKTRPETDAVIFMVSDQPFACADLLRSLIHTWQNTGKGMVCSYYGDTAGVPALFNRSYFQELLSLQGDTGARKIILQHSNDMATVPFPEGDIDIDTREDYENLIKKN